MPEARDQISTVRNRFRMLCTTLYAAKADVFGLLASAAREGFFAEWQYSSVLTQGAGILGTLLGMPGVRVLFKPHPGTGTDDFADFRGAARIEHDDRGAFFVFELE